MCLTDRYSHANVGVSFLSSGPQLVQADVPVLLGFLPVRREVFFSTVALSLLRTGDCSEDSQQSVGFFREAVYFYFHLKFEFK